MSKRTINLITIVIVVVAIFFAYRFFFVTPEPEAEPGVVTTASSVPDADISGGDFLALLLSVQDINLSKNVFNNPIFRDRLKDFGRELPSRVVGRSNPFAPFGVGDVGTSTTGARLPVGTSTAATSSASSATTTSSAPRAPAPTPAPAPAPVSNPTSPSQGSTGTDFEF
jgi:cell division septation protein DedD